MSEVIPPSALAAMALKHTKAFGFGVMDTSFYKVVFKHSPRNNLKDEIMRMSEKITFLEIEL